MFPNVSFRAVDRVVQAAHAFWRKLVNAVRKGRFKQSKADPCLFCTWTASGLLAWISWVDDCVVMGNKQGVPQAKQHLMSQFKCEEQGKLEEFVGCKVDCRPDKGEMKTTQPVLVQSLHDEFDVPEGDTPVAPADDA